MCRHMVLPALVLLLVAPGYSAPEAEQGTLAFVVTEEDGTPLSGAEVGAWNNDDQWRGRTDEHGRARLTGIPPGPVMVYAAAERHVTSPSKEVLVKPGVEDSIHLKLAAGVPFDGRVIDAEGKPVPDAFVTVEAGGTFEGFAVMLFDHPPYGWTGTDEEGRFHIGGIPPDSIATVVVEAEGLTTARIGVKAVGDKVRPSPLVIRLSPGVKLTGTVHDPKGKPAVGALVCVVPAEDEDLRANPMISKVSTDGTSVKAHTARANNAGEYVVSGLEAGRAYIATALAQGFSRPAWSAPFTLTPKKPQHRIAIRLAAPAGILVRLLDEEGKPVSDARVRLGGSMGGFEKTEADEPGVYRFETVPLDIAEVHVRCPRYLDRREAVEVREGETVEVDIALSTGAVIAGVLVDEKGRPLPKVSVEVEKKDDDEAGWHDMTAGRAQTDEKGDFEILGLKPGRHEVKIWARGLALAEPVFATAPARNLRVVAVHLGSLTVRFAMPDGSAPPDKVTLHYRKGDTWHGGNRERLEAGRLRVPKVVGPLHLRVGIEGFVQFHRDVEVPPGEELDLGTVVLDPGLTLSGRVVDPEGKGVAEARLFHRGYSTTTAPSGVFELPHQPKGEVEIHVSAEGYADRAVKAVVGGDSKPIVITLSPEK